MTELNRAEGRAATMLRFLILTACRTNEVVGARWSEINSTAIDLKDHPRLTWKIPGARMKMNQDHVIPLSAPALIILDKMRDGSQGELILSRLIALGSA